MTPFVYTPTPAPVPSNAPCRSAPPHTGVTKLLDAQHLHAAKAQVLYDLGMGTGKLCMQAFLQHESLRLVFGIELAHSR